MLKAAQKHYFIPVDAHGQELRDQGRERELEDMERNVLKGEGRCSDEEWWEDKYEQ